MSQQRSKSVPPAMQATFVAVVALTDQVCQQYLNGEYATLCRELAAARRVSSIICLRHAAYATISSACSHHVKA